MAAAAANTKWDHMTPQDSQAVPPRHEPAKVAAHTTVFWATELWSLAGNKSPNQPKIIFKESHVKCLLPKWTND